MKTLTLAFISHDRFDETSKYVNKIVEKIPKSIKVVFIFDNLLNDEQVKTIHKDVLLFHGENKGKLAAILSASTNFETKFVKVVDQDDCVDFRYLVDLEKKLSSKSINNFYFHKASKINSDSDFFGKITTDEDELDLIRKDSYDVGWNKIPNAQAIYNVDVLIELSKLNITRQNYFNDDFLALSCQLLKKKTVKINSSFYYQYHNLGQTSVIKESKAKSLYELFKNLNVVKNKLETSTKGMYSKKIMLKRSNNYQERMFRDANVENYKHWIKLANNELGKLFIKNKLTLIITIHSDMEAIDFYLELLIDVKNDILFAFDNPEIPNDKIDLILSHGHKCYVNKENTGKVWLILNSLDLVETEYFKIIDQDDSISVIELKKFNSKINRVKGPMIIKHKALKISNNFSHYERSLDLEVIKKQVKNSDDVFYNQQTNCDTIYHTTSLRIINEKKIKLSRQSFHNDVLLSNLMVGMGLELKVINQGFYIQFHEMGQTSTTNIKRSECILELYKNYELLTNTIPGFSISKTMNSDFKNHRRFVDRFTNKYLKELEPEKGEELFKETMKIVEKIWEIEQQQ